MVIAIILFGHRIWQIYADDIFHAVLGTSQSSKTTTTHGTGGSKPSADVISRASVQSNTNTAFGNLKTMTLHRTHVFVRIEINRLALFNMRWSLCNLHLFTKAQLVILKLDDHLPSKSIREKKEPQYAPVKNPKFYILEKPSYRVLSGSPGTNDQFLIRLSSQSLVFSLLFENESLHNEWIGYFKDAGLPKSASD